MSLIESQIWIIEFGDIIWNSNLLPKTIITLIKPGKILFNEIFHKITKWGMLGFFNKTFDSV